MKTVVDVATIWFLSAVVAVGFYLVAESKIPDIQWAVHTITIVFTYVWARAPDVFWFSGFKIRLRGGDE